MKKIFMISLMLLSTFSFARESQIDFCYNQSVDVFEASRCAFKVLAKSHARVKSCVCVFVEKGGHDNCSVELKTRDRSSGQIKTVAGPFGVKGTVSVCGKEPLSRPEIDAFSLCENKLLNTAECIL